MLDLPACRIFVGEGRKPSREAAGLLSLPLLYLGAFSPGFSMALRAVGKAGVNPRKDHREKTSVKRGNTLYYIVLLCNVLQYILTKGKNWDIM